jgi:hypothetical protein
LAQHQGVSYAELQLLGLHLDGPVLMSMSDDATAVVTLVLGVGEYDDLLLRLRSLRPASNVANGDTIMTG